MTEGGRKSGSLLGVAAYLLVPGERRRRAAGHFRRAGLEFLMGVGELARPTREGTNEPRMRSGRERIEVE